MTPSPAQPLSGQQLIADYQNAIITASTAEAAQYAAESSENDLLQRLDALSSGRYLNPGTITNDVQAAITHASLDAHFKKVQAKQMESMSLDQLQSLAMHDQRLYTGRRVRVSTLGTAHDVIEVLSFDDRRGYHSSPVNRRSISGIIEEVLLDRNVLVLRPTFGVRLINSSLQNYIVYVIDPENFQPLVELTF